MKKAKKEHVSVVIIGHVDSGKSTTSGHLIYKCGGIDLRTIEKFRKEAAEMGKESFAFAWVMDVTAAERTRGITVVQSVKKAETKNREVSIIDAPGHRDFIKNMISGAAYADYPAIVVPSSPGEFETAISEEGSTFQHAKLALTMGSKCPIVLVNKMDACNYSETRYNEIVKTMRAGLTKMGYPADSISFLPISGLLGDNLFEVSDKMPWYSGWEYTYKHPEQGVLKMKGRTMYDWLDSLALPPRFLDKPLRGSTSEAFKVEGAGTIVTGRVDSGILKPGMVLHFVPSNITAEVKSVEMHHTTLDQAEPGDSIGMNLKNVAVLDVKRGNVFGDPKNHPPCETKSFKAVIIIVSPIVKKGVGVGYAPVVDCHSSHTPCRISDILYRLDRKSGSQLPPEDETGRKCLKNGDSGFVEIIPKQPLCVEKFSDYPGLGRVVLRDSNQAIAVGVIKEVERMELQGKAAVGKGKAAPKKKK